MDLALPRAPPSGIGTLSVQQQQILYSKKDTIEISERFDSSATRFFVFVRHPASFFRSAKSYHFKGQEEWAMKNTSKILNYNSLTEALRDCKDSDDKLILVKAENKLVSIAKSKDTSLPTINPKLNLSHSLPTQCQK